MIMASYHYSKQKRRNRAFKLGFFRKAVRYLLNRGFGIRGAAEEEPITFYSLCGNNVELESKLLRYARKKGADMTDFNSWANDSKREEYLSALHDLKERGLTTKNIALYNCTFVPKQASGMYYIVDLDTCSHFTKKLADQIIRLCSDDDYPPICVAITFIKNGLRCPDSWLNLPEGLGIDDISDVDKIGAWIENKCKDTTKLKYIGNQVYRNDGASSTMATIIMARCKSFAKYQTNNNMNNTQSNNSVEVPAELTQEVKNFAKKLLRKYSTQEVASALKLNPNSVRGLKAMNHPTFKKKFAK
jgi:DNA primase